MILVTTVEDSDLKALRRNGGNDKIVRTKALKFQEKLAIDFGNFKADNDKNWTILFGLLFLT